MSNFRLQLFHVCLKCCFVISVCFSYYSRTANFHVRLLFCPHYLTLTTLAPVCWQIWYIFSQAQLVQNIISKCVCLLGTTAGVIRVVALLEIETHFLRIREWQLILHKTSTNPCNTFIVSAHFFKRNDKARTLRKLKNWKRIFHCRWRYHSNTRNNWTTTWIQWIAKFSRQ